MTSDDRYTRLQRATNPIPDDVWQAIVERRLEDAYRERPLYQQNDYIGWIQQAKRDETRQRRLNQMLDELKQGDRYMRMKWRPRR